MPCMITETNRRRYIGQQPGTKSAFRPADKPLVNRWSTAGFVPPPVYIGFPLFVLAKRRSEQLFTVPWRARETVAFWADRNVGTLFCPASSRPAVRRAPRRIDPSVVCPCFRLDRLCYGRLCYALHEKVYSDKYASVHCSAARNEERSRSW